MADVWLPGFERRSIGQPTGGSYDEDKHAKLGWHTWEGTNWDAAEAAFKPYPPHCAVHPGLRRKGQYVPLNRHAYAFAGNDADDSWIIQVEVAGFAADSRNWSEDDLRWLGEEVARPIAETVGVPPIIVPQGFHDGTEGIFPYISTASSPIRFKTYAELDAFTGHCGHQHMPSPDKHWDPGRLPIQKILEYAHPSEEEFHMTPAEAKQVQAIVKSELMLAVAQLTKNLDVHIMSGRGWSEAGALASGATRDDAVAANARYNSQ